MAVFGDIKDVEEQDWPLEVVKAICTAYKVQNSFQKLRVEWEEKWLFYHQRNRPEEIAPTVGIGIHIGLASFGFFGSEAHKEFTAIGDAVNFTQRIESIAGKEDRENILISQPMFYHILDINEKTYANVFDTDLLKKHSISLKGKSYDYPVWGVTNSPEKICRKIMGEKICDRCWYYEQ